MRFFGMDEEINWPEYMIMGVIGLMVYSMVNTFLYGPPHDQIAEAKQKKVLEEKLLSACKNSSLPDKCLYIMKQAGITFDYSKLGK